MQRLHMMGANGAPGSRCRGCRNAATGLLHDLRGDHRPASPPQVWHRALAPPASLDPAQQVKRLCHQIAGEVGHVVQGDNRFVFFSSDHSQAMGIWCGTLRALRPRRLGLLWIDAHLDAHTTHTSPSGNYHGMPVAALLGANDRLLNSICGTPEPLSAEQICLVGAHSYEPEEHALLESLGVRIFDLHAVHRQGLARVMNRAWRQLARGADVLGVSLDLDAVDPADVPAVATPVFHGLASQELLPALADLPRPIGLEIAEYNPCRDHCGRTRAFLRRAIVGTFYEKNMPYRSLGSRGNASRSLSVPRSRSLTSS